MNRGGQELLDDHGAPRVPEGAVAHGGAHGAEGLLGGRRHDDALACGQAIGLHDERTVRLTHVALGGVGVVEHLERGRRDAMTLQELLHEDLRALEARRRLRGPEGRDFRLRQRIDEAQRQGHLGAYDDEIDALHEREGHETVDVVGLDGPVGSVARGAAIAGRAEHHVSFRREAANDGVLSRSRADDEDFHGGHGGCWTT